MVLYQSDKKPFEPFDLALKSSITPSDSCSDLTCAGSTQEYNTPGSAYYGALMEPTPAFGFPAPVSSGTAAVYPAPVASASATNPYPWPLPTLVEQQEDDVGSAMDAELAQPDNLPFDPSAVSPSDSSRAYSLNAPSVHTRIDEVFDTPSTYYRNRDSMTPPHGPNPILVEPQQDDDEMVMDDEMEW